MEHEADSGEQSGAPISVLVQGRGAQARAKPGARGRVEPGAASDATTSALAVGAKATLGQNANPGRAAAYPGHAAFLPYVLNRATSALNADFQLVLREHGMTLLHWRVLAFLRDADGLGVSALANITGSDQATLSRALTVMEKAGYIARHPDPIDQRVAAIRLCPAGRKQFARVLPIALQLHQCAVAGLSQQEQDTLIGLLNRIRANVLTREG